MVNKGREKVRDIAFSKAMHIMEGFGYSDELTPVEFLHIIHAGAESSPAYSYGRALHKKQEGVSGRTVYWWKWTKTFSNAYWEWRTPRLGKGG